MASASTLPRRSAGELVPAARSLARMLLQHDPQRLAHVAGAARAAEYACHRLTRVPVDLVIAAAWLHDIGYTPTLAATGFHPLDGARYLRQGGWDDMVVRLVAHHSHSALMAPHFEVADEMATFAPVEGLVADTLTFADVVAGADGKGSTVEDRIADLRARSAGDPRVPRKVHELRFRGLIASVESVQAAMRRSARATARRRSSSRHASDNRAQHEAPTVLRARPDDTP